MPLAVQLCMKQLWNGYKKLLKHFPSQEDLLQSVLLTHGVQYVKYIETTLPLKSNTLVTKESGSGKILGLKALIKQGGGTGGGGEGGCYFIYLIVVMKQTMSKKNSMFLAMFKFVFSAIALSKS